MLLQIVISLALGILASVGAIETLRGSFQILQYAKDIEFTSTEASSVNFALQKLIGNSASFALYGTVEEARSGDSAGLVTDDALAVRLTYDGGKIAVLYYDVAAKQLVYEMITPAPTQWVIAGGFEAVSFHLSDPQDPQVQGLLVATLDMKNRRIPCYVERY